ncbi:MAG: hypothetical protein AAFX81_17985 [Pseudomonadota bacterium]
MELDDEAALASLLVTARAVLRERLLPELGGERRTEAAMVANAMAIAARALTHPGPAWAAREVPALPVPPTPADVQRLVAALRPHVAARLEVTQPGYVAAVDGAPP